MLITADPSEYPLQLGLVVVANIEGVSLTVILCEIDDEQPFKSV